MVSTQDRGFLERAAPWAWGAVAVTWLARFYFTYGPGEMHLNDEGYSYAYRVMEFADLLRAGYPFPQWAVDFDLGLGSPYFGYYQPLFFYLASAFVAVLPLPTAIAVTVWSLALTGYGGMLVLVRRRFGAAAGTLAGTALLAAPYVRTELYRRGDLSEFTGMMLLPAALHWMTTWLDEGRPIAWFMLAGVAAALVCAHPVTGLLGYGALVVVVACWLVTGVDRRRAATAVAALGAGVGFVGFYVLPLALEWPLVQGARLTFGDAPLAFIELGALLGLREPTGRYAPPTALGTTTLGLVGVAAVLAVWRWREMDLAQRRLIGSMAVIASGVVWLMHPTSSLVWETLPLLRFLQFPWRALLVLSVVLASLVGALVGRRPASALVACALFAASTSRFHTLGTSTSFHPASPRGLADKYVAPDAAHEWLPRDADVLLAGRTPSAPVCTSTCSIAGFARDAGRLRARVTAIGETEVTLPHYWFPVGWQATFDGVAVPLERAEHGLMRVTLGRAGQPISGQLDLRFTTTPARRLGIAVSTATLLLLIALALHGRRRTAGES